MNPKENSVAIRVEASDVSVVLRRLAVLVLVPVENARQTGVPVEFRPRPGTVDVEWKRALVLEPSERSLETEAREVDQRAALQPGAAFAVTRGNDRKVLRLPDRDRASRLEPTRRETQGEGLHRNDLEVAAVLTDAAVEPDSGVVVGHVHLLTVRREPDPVGQRPARPHAVAVAFDEIHSHDGVVCLVVPIVGPERDPAAAEVRRRAPRLDPSVEVASLPSRHDDLLRVRRYPNVLVVLFVADPQGEGAEAPRVERGVEDLLGALERGVGLDDPLQVAWILSGERQRVEKEARDERKPVEFAVTLHVAGGKVESVGDLDLDAAVTAPLLVAGARGNRLGESLEEAADLERNQVAGQVLRLRRRGIGVGSEVAGGDLHAVREPAYQESGSHRHVDLDARVPLEIGQRDRRTEDRSGIVPGAFPGGESQALRLAELSPALDHASGEVTGMERDADAGFLLGVLEVRSETKLVSSDHVGRSRGSIEPIERVADDRSQNAVGEDLRLDVEQMTGPIVRVLAGDDSTIEERIGERRKRAEELHPPVVDPHSIDAGLPRFEAEPSGWTDAHVVGIHPQRVEERAPDRSGRESE